MARRDRTKAPRVGLSITLPPDVYEVLLEVADELVAGRSLIVEHALRHYFETHELTARRSMTRRPTP